MSIDVRLAGKTLVRVPHYAGQTYSPLQRNQMLHASRLFRYLFSSHCRHFEIDNKCLLPRH